jgi:hypothetical protein
MTTAFLLKEKGSTKVACLPRMHYRKVVLPVQNLLHLSCSGHCVKEIKKYETGVPSNDGTKLNFVKIGHVVQKLLVLTCADLHYRSTSIVFSDP